MDTGAQCYCLIGSKFIPPGARTVARRPLNLRGAQDACIPGGVFGAFGDLTIPVLCGSQPKFFCLKNCFFYEAEIGNQLILGYPLLKKYALFIDTVSDCLRPTESVTFKDTTTESCPRGQPSATSPSRLSSDVVGPESGQVVVRDPVVSSESPDYGGSGSESTSIQLTFVPDSVPSCARMPLPTATAAETSKRSPQPPFSVMTTRGDSDVEEIGFCPSEATHVPSVTDLTVGEPGVRVIDHMAQSSPPHRRGTEENSGTVAPGLGPMPGADPSPSPATHSSMELDASEANLFLLENA